MSHQQQFRKDLLLTIQSGNFLEAIALIRKTPSISQRLTDEAFRMVTKTAARKPEAAKLILQITRQLVVLFTADIHQNEEESLRTAVLVRNAALVQFLLAEGADLHAREDECLQLAVRNNHLSMVDYLIRKGANVHAKNNTAVKIALKYRFSDIIYVLLRAGVKDSLVLRNYTLSETERKTFAMFFTSFCEAVQTATDQDLSVLRGALIQGQFFPSEDLRTIEKIKYGDRKTLCDWMKVRLYVSQVDCQSTVEPTTKQSLLSIPLVALYTMEHPITKEKLCFDIFGLFKSIQNAKARGLPVIPIPTIGREGEVASTFTSAQIQDIELVFGARMRLFWQLRKVLQKA